MSAAADYGNDDLNAQMKAWFDAETAYRRRDIGSVATLLVPPGRTDRDTYAFLVSQTMVGAALCAVVVAKLNDMPPLERPTDGVWALEQIGRREGSAAERMAGVVVTTAANGELDRLGDQVNAFAGPDDRGVKRITDLLLQLMSVWVALQDADNARPPTSDA